jgi:hypothetical protein
MRGRLTSHESDLSRVLPFAPADPAGPDIGGGGVAFDGGAPSIRRLMTLPLLSLRARIAAIASLRDCLDVAEDSVVPLESSSSWRDIIRKRPRKAV